MHHSACPNRDQLRGYLLGQVPGSIGPNVLEHLAACPTCAALAARLDGVSDSLMNDLRGLSALGAVAPDLPPESRTVTAVSDPAPEPTRSHVPLGAGAPDQPAGGGIPTAHDAGPEEVVGAVIAGKYKLVEAIGEGGMGSVFLAQQTAPVKRLVAVKVIKAGMDSKAVLARFEAERQALALMDHPNIAKVLDAGATGSGRPFFVMELVKGTPITKFCDDRRLAVRDRLVLFADVCRAVQHAHQKGIIHRDIKPGNVLVAPYDGNPVVKVIDFGVAKAAGQPLTDRTLVTGLGAVVGTPEYMSPEQAELNNQDVDTRSDVYALGVLLYELLTGTTPLTRKRIKQAALLEVLRAVREEEPPRPSTRLSTTDELPSIAAVRASEPARLSRLVRGELDWIVMKALEKDRNRRYESATGFAKDVERYLSDESVQACPPTVAYRLRKVIRRNKALVGTTVLIAVVLILATLVSIASAVRAWAAEEVARTNLSRAEELARTEAEAQARAAHADGERRVERANAEAAEVRARAGVESAVARAAELRKKYRFDDASAALRQAAALIPAAAPAELHAVLRRATDDLAFVSELDAIRMKRSTWAESGNGKGQFDGAGAPPAYARAFRARALDVTGGEPMALAARVRASEVAADLVAALDDWAVFEPDPVVRERVLAVARIADPGAWTDRFRDPVLRADRDRLARLAGEADPGTLAPPTASALAELMWRSGLDPSALLAAAQFANPSDFQLPFTLGQFALYVKRDRPAAAAHYRTARAIRPTEFAVLTNLGIALSGAGERDAALRCFHAVVGLHPRSAQAHYNLGAEVVFAGDRAGAIPHFQTAIALDTNYAKAHFSLGQAYLVTGKPDLAEACYRRVLEIDEKYAPAHVNLGALLGSKKDPVGALKHYRRAVEIDENYAHAHFCLGAALLVANDLKDARVHLERAVALDEKAPHAHNELATALARGGDADGAIVHFQTAVELDPTNPKYQQNLTTARKQKAAQDQPEERFATPPREEP